MIDKNKKIVIIGAGLIGSSIAWHLSNEGYNIHIVEKNYLLDMGASGSCEGLMLLQSKKPGLHLNMAMKSIQMYEDMQKDLDFDTEYMRTGGIVLIHSQREMEILNDYVKKQKASGAQIDMLDAKQVKYMVPEVASDIQGGSFSKNDAIINPMNLTHAWIQGCIKNGVKIEQNTTVEDIILTNNEVTAIKTNKGVIEADLIINAAGPYGGEIAKMVNLDVPLFPRKGEIMVTRANKKPVLKYPLLSATYIAAKYDPEIAAQGTGFAIDQVHNGNILIGSTREFVEFDQSSTIKGMSTIAKSINKTLPGLGDFEIIRSFSGLRPYTPDGLPLIGEHKDVKGFFFACGHEGDGVTLAAVTGDLVSRMIRGLECDFDMNNFDPSRFDKKDENE